VEIAAKIHEPSMQFPQYNCRALYPRVSKPLRDWGLESFNFYVNVPETGDKNFEIIIGLRKGHTLCNKLLEKVMTKTPIFTELVSNFFGQNFFGCILSLRPVYKEICMKFRIFDTHFCTERHGNNEKRRFYFYFVRIFYRPRIYTIDEQFFFTFHFTDLYKIIYTLNFHKF
jgi:hypothetical protein